MNETDTTEVPQNTGLFDPNGQTPPDAGGLPRGKPFAKGTSGNPSGRVPGSRNNATRLAQALFDTRAAAVSDRAIELALEGNGAALKFCLERILPRQRESAVMVDLPPLDTIKDCSDAIAMVIATATAGEITLRDAQTLIAMIESHCETIATDRRPPTTAAIRTTGDHAQSPSPNRW